MGDVWERLLKERGYKIQHTLGEGAYSKVKSAYSSRLGREVAIKCINTQVAPKDFVEKFLPRELKTLPLLRHENIVRVYEILEASDGYVYIVMEAARNGDMLRYIQRKGAMPETEIKYYFYQLLQAINYCHAQNICHRDLKCENLLLDKDYKLLLTDFGFSKSMIFDGNGDVTLSSTFCGSAAYAAPEIIQGQPYDPRMHDMWSMGVILYIMSCGHMPFDDSNVKKMLRVQLKNHLKFPPKVANILSEDLKHLIRSLIQPDVSQRATMAVVMRHPFLAGQTGRLTRPSSSSSVAQQIFEFFTGSHNNGHGTGGGSQGQSTSHGRERSGSGGGQRPRQRPHASSGRPRSAANNATVTDLSDAVRQKTSDGGDDDDGDRRSATEDQQQRKSNKRQQLSSCARNDDDDGDDDESAENVRSHRSHNNRERGGGRDRHQQQQQQQRGGRSVQRANEDPSRHGAHHRAAGPGGGSARGHRKSLASSSAGSRGASADAGASSDAARPRSPRSNGAKKRRRKGGAGGGGVSGRHHRGIEEKSK